MSNKDTNKDNITVVKLSFAALNPTVETTIPTPTEKVISGKNYVEWGEKNEYPQYLRSLYNEVTTLQSIIEGTVDFVCGNNVTIDETSFDIQINEKGVQPEDFVRDIARDYMTFGGFAINVLRNKAGKVCALHYIPFERIRCNEDKTKFYYSTEFGVKYGRVKSIELPKFEANKQDVSSIYYYSNNNSSVYPNPKWSACVESCEIEKMVNTYHMNGISNGFSSNYIVNLNNGIPNDEQKQEIEENFNDKFCGQENAGRLIISYNPDKDHESTLQKLETDDIGEKYNSLVERTRTDIFTAFRAMPQLFGMNLNTGFSTQEYEDAFRLYNRTAVRPVQKIICRVISTILGVDVKIEPFTLD